MVGARIRISGVGHGCASVRLCAEFRRGDSAGRRRDGVELVDRCAGRPVAGPPLARPQEDDHGESESRPGTSTVAGTESRGRARDRALRARAPSDGGGAGRGAPPPGPRVQLLADVQVTGAHAHAYADGKRNCTHVNPISMVDAKRVAGASTQRSGPGPRFRQPEGRFDGPPAAGTRGQRAGRHPARPGGLKSARRPATPAAPGRRGPRVPPRAAPPSAPLVGGRAGRRAAAGHGVPAPAVLLEAGTALRLGAYRLSVRSERDAGAAVAEAPSRDGTRPLGGALAPGRGAVVLRWIDRNGRAEQRRLEPGETLVGRHPSCDLVLPDASVSARHARIVTDVEGTVLEDLASLNGCWLDGRRIWVAGLAPGSELRLGSNAVQVIGEELAGSPDGTRPTIRPVFPHGLRAPRGALHVAAPPAEPCGLLVGTGIRQEVLARRLPPPGGRAGGPFVVNAAALPRSWPSRCSSGTGAGRSPGRWSCIGGVRAGERRHAAARRDRGDAARLSRRSVRGAGGGARASSGGAGHRRRRAPSRRRTGTPPAAVRAGAVPARSRHRLSVFVADSAAARAARRHRPAGRGDPRRFGRAGRTVADDRGRAGGAAPARLAGERARAAQRAAAECCDRGGGRIDAAAVRRALDRDGTDFATTRPEIDPERVLADNGGNVTAAARAAGIARSTFRDLLRQRTRERSGGSAS